MPLLNAADVAHTNAKAILDGGPVETFRAYRKDSGEEITVDVRTFDEATMSKEPPEPAKVDLPAA